MEKDLSHYRITYEKGELLLENSPDNPIVLFRDWFTEVDKHYNVGETNAMTISTIGVDGFPKSRVVLLKKYSVNGFVFYTNYNSEKGKAIANNNNTCLSFFWQAAERQVIIKGCAQKIPEHLSDAYFESRPRGSQIGALVSNQSETITDRFVLEDKLKTLEKHYKNTNIKRPKHWGGYLVKPLEFEFWQGRTNRLHDRITYQLQPNATWKKRRLAP